MKHCENCGAELQEGMKFCGDCGSPVPMEENEIKLEAAMETPMNPGIAGPSPGNGKKTIIAAMAIAVLLIVAAVALWQSGAFGKQEKPIGKEATQTIDKNDLRGTLDWKEDQDKEHELKNSLIEGNSDSNVKEIFGESAYFTPTKYAYAANENVTYYSIECEYEKEDKALPYTLVFQVNQDEHLELAELYKDEKKVDREKFDGFYEKLYTTKEDLEAAETTVAATEASKPEPDNPYEGKKFYPAGGNGGIVYVYFAEVNANEGYVVLQIQDYDVLGGTLIDTQTKKFYTTNGSYFVTEDGDCGMMLNTDGSISIIYQSDEVYDRYGESQETVYYPS